jgi:hypothetical protein
MRYSVAETVPPGELAAHPEMLRACEHLSMSPKLLPARRQQQRIEESLPAFGTQLQFRATSMARLRLKVPTGNDDVGLL